MFDHLKDGVSFVIELLNLQVWTDILSLSMHPH